MHNPHYINHYADRFINLGLVAFGVNFEQYLAAPAATEARYADRHLPLLPAQIAVQQRLDADEARQQQRQSDELEADEYQIEKELDDFPRRNGIAVEPLHFRRHYKRSHKADFRRRTRHAG